jgi:DnaJ-domain-containing protein 1
MDDPLKRAKVYRLRAEEIRTAADGMRHQTNRATLLRIADDYDLMAETIEQKARARDQTKSVG